MNSRRALFTAALGLALIDTRGKAAPPEVQTVADVAGQLARRRRREHDVSTKRGRITRASRKPASSR
jgi:hypothetical protein